MVRTNKNVSRKNKNSKISKNSKKYKTKHPNNTESGIKLYISAMVRIIVLPIKSFTFGTKSNDEPSVAAAADPAAGGTFSAFDISIHST